MRAGLDRYCETWGLSPAGEVLETHSSLLRSVRTDGVRAMLKLPLVDEERRGCSALTFWGGEGAVRVLRTDGRAFLLEWAADDIPLTDMATGGRDSEATAILCRAAMSLHEARGGVRPSGLTPLRRWFAGLGRAAEKGGENQALFRAALEIASPLLEAPESEVVLHGDIHHGNVLHDPVRGWLAIDPKGLVGDRGFDFANILCNPTAALARAPGRLAAQAGVVAAISGLSLRRVLQWTAAYAGLSAAWSAESTPEQATDGLAMARLAQAELAAAAA